MANVKVVIEEIIKGAGNVSQVAGDLNEVEQASERANTTSQRLSSSFTEFNSALSLVNQGLGYIKEGVQATYGEFSKYAEQVRDVSAVSGTGAVETSKFLQVLDDYQLSAEDATTAVRAMTKNGLVPNIETLAKLSDEYKAIQDPMQRNDFILKNLGKSGLQWTNVLKQGGDALRAQSDEVSKSLILTDEQIRKSEQARLAIDAWNDSIQGLKISIGSMIGDLIVSNDNHSKAIELLKAEGVTLGRGVENTQAYKDALAKVEEQQRTLADTTQTLDSSTQDLSATQEAAAKEAVKKLSDSYNGLLSSMFSIDKQNEDYQKTIDGVAAKDKDLAEQKQRLTYEWYQAKQAGKDTIEAYNEYIKKSYELTKAQEDNQASVATATEENKKAADQRIFDLVREQVTADGTSTAEFEKLQELAVSKGLVSRAAADQAIAERKAADDIVKGFGDVNLSMDQTIERMLQIRALGGMVPFGVDFTSNIPVPSGNTFGTNGINYSQTATQTPFQGTPQTRDSGGWGMPGQTYSIGTGAQPETFTPAVPGYFTPANQQSKNVNINITVGAMNGMQDIDYLAQEIARRVTVA